ncbi:MAG TPA: hypothetical protein PLK35_02315 [Candidatus Moranbacteria bacterium]|nr:hypothetical protein [Candidatus Moranbacteria bacterium]
MNYIRTCTYSNSDTIPAKAMPVGRQAGIWFRILAYSLDSRSSRE